MVGIDQTQAALVQDSSEYDVDRIQARFIEVINGIDNRTFELVDTLLENKEDDGVFFAPEHTAYFAKTTGNDQLNPDAEYRLELTIDDTVNVSAVTNMIGVTVGNITQPPMGIDNLKLGFASVGSTVVQLLQL